MRFPFPILFSLLLMGSCQEQAQAPQAPRKAVFILIDGISSDVIEKVETPTLDEIAAAGGYTRAYVGGETARYNETPTISAPGYMSMLTGVWAHKHNIWDNYEQSPNYAYWNVFRIAERADSTLKTAIFSTWLDNRTILVGDGQPACADFRIDYGFDGFELDSVRFPHDEASDYVLAIDELVSEEAGRYIAENGPDLSWVYLQYTDDMGHYHGDSEKFYEAVRKADNQVKKVWEGVKKRQALGEDWMIVVTTDHGRDSLSGMDHGGQSARERATWIVTNHTQLNSRFSAGDPPIIDITPSILRHLGIEIPEETAREMEGIPFIGAISVEDFQLTLQGDQLLATWNPLNPEGKARLMVSFTNQFQKGGSDSYIALAEVPVSDGKCQVTLSPEQAGSGFIKAVLEAPLNRCNRWYKAEK